MNYTQIFKTVPIANTEMVRDATGVKCDLQGKRITFKGDWTKYTEGVVNSDNTPLLGAIAGTDFIAVDIDQTNTYIEAYNLLKGNEVLPTFIVNSLPLDLGKGGHLLFSYDVETERELKAIRKYLKKHCHIDIQIGRTLIYLPTEANHTKQLITPPITSISDLTPFPTIMLTYLKGLVTKYIIKDLEEAENTKVKVQLGDTQTTEFYGFILDGELRPSIVSRLTPKRDYRNITEMNQITEGQGTDWMLQVRKKLQRDTSVDEDTLLKTMLYLNSLWNLPMTVERVTSDVMRDIKSSEFVYNENWRGARLLLSTLNNNHTLEVLFIYKRSEFAVFNRTLEEVDLYTTFTALQDVLVALTGHVLTKDVVLKRAVKVTVVDTPEDNAFLVDNIGRLPSFNTFIPSEGLLILRDTVELTNYREPRLILDFLSNLIPDELTKDKFIQYLAYKYSTYDYSPLFFVQAGVGGAGKGILVGTILSYLSGRKRVSSIRMHQLVNNFNSHMVGTDWLEIAEAGEGYSKTEEKKLVAELKRLTGSKYVSVTYKNSEPEDYRHYVTPILSTNLETKLITDSSSNDRRMVLLKSPNKMTDILPYKWNGVVLKDTSEFLKGMEEELPLFAKYLGKLHENSPLSHTDYRDNTVWKNKDYEEYIDNSLEDYEKVLNALGNKDWKSLSMLLSDFGVTQETLDNLIQLSTKGNNTWCVLYNTSASNALGVISLEDVLGGIPEASTLTRRMLSAHKTVLVKRYSSMQYRLNVVVFNDVYHTSVGTKDVLNDKPLRVVNTDLLPIEETLVQDLYKYK